MNITDFTKGMFGFNFRFYCVGQFVKRGDLYITTVMADSQSQAMEKFHTCIKNIDTSREISIEQH